MVIDHALIEDYEKILNHEHVSFVFPSGADHEEVGLSRKKVYEFSGTYMIIYEVVAVCQLIFYYTISRMFKLPGYSSDRPGNNMDSPEKV